MRTAWIASVLVASACTDSPPPVQEVELGPLRFEVTDGWTRTDGTKGLASAMFAPSDNHRAESVTVIRARRGDSKATSFEGLLVTAQGSLRDVKVRRFSRVKTAKGLVGARVDVAFKPEGRTETYRRTHIVLEESASTLVHVLYTAKTPDAQQMTMQRVLDSLHVSSTEGGRS